MKKFFTFVSKKSRILGGLGLRKFRIVNAIHGYVARKAFGDKAETNGYTLFIDPAEGFLIDSVWEEETTTLIKNKFKPGGIFVDIGADIGYYTCLAAKLGAGRVYAFEPNPHTRKLLEKNIAINGFKNVTVFDKALSDKAEKKHFYTHGSHSTMGFNYNKNTSARTTIEVETVLLDELLDKVDFIKMDIEGSEPKALRGMRNILKKNEHVQLVTEFFPQLIRLSGESPEEFLNDLQGLGFTIYDMNDLNKPASLKELVAAYEGDSEKPGVHSENSVANLYCVK